MPANIAYRQVVRDDLPAIGAVFLAAFPDSVAHYVGHSIPPDVMADALAICLDAEPAAFFIARVDDHIAGYIFAPAHTSRLVKTFLWRGYIARMVWGWLSGRYQLGWRPVWISLKNWLHFLRDADNAQLGSDARIFSVAVDPAFQGKGLGNQLMRLGLDYLREQRAEMVRLEVRPDNGPARHLYEKTGFVPRGCTHDSQGEWLIMLKKMRNGHGA